MRALLGIAVALSALPVLSQLWAWFTGERLDWSGYTAADVPAVPEQIHGGASGRRDDQVRWQIPHWC